MKYLKNRNHDQIPTKNLLLEVNIAWNEYESKFANIFVWKLHLSDLPQQEELDILDFHFIIQLIDKVFR